MKNKLTILLLISLFIVTGTYAQNKKQKKKVVLKGLVLDTENRAIQNASVFIDGKKLNTVTNGEGRFQIKIKPNIKSITVFSLFHGAAELNYSGEEELTFVLSNNDVQTDPLNDPNKEQGDMVNIGYGSADKRNLTSSVGTVDKNRLKNSTHYNTIYDMIKGEVPGVVVNGESITIRGMSSLNLSNEPLYVVNGSPSSTISNISPNDVKSISVLKGSSAAIYGSRGANGVIVIVLKSAGDL